MEARDNSGVCIEFNSDTPWRHSRENRMRVVICMLLPPATSLANASVYTVDYYASFFPHTARIDEHATLLDAALTLRSWATLKKLIRDRYVRNVINKRNKSQAHDEEVYP